MKFSVVAIFLLSPALLSFVSALENDDGNEGQDRSSVVKTICKTSSQTQLCLGSLIAAETPPGAGNGFVTSSPYDDNLGIESNYFGACSSAIAAVRSSKGCGLQDCPTIACYLADLR